MGGGEGRGKQGVRENSEREQDTMIVTMTAFCTVKKRKKKNII
jgi:hypothetical protein